MLTYIVMAVTVVDFKTEQLARHFFNVCVYALLVCAVCVALCALCALCVLCVLCVCFVCFVCALARFAGRKRNENGVVQAYTATAA